MHRTYEPGAQQRRARFHEELIARLHALPGVIAAGGVNAFPMSGGPSNGRFFVLSAASERWVADTIARCGAHAFASPCLPENSKTRGGFFQDETMTGEAEFRVASDGYFGAMGIPLLRGRLFEERDAPDAPHAALISESLARSRWPDQDPIGSRVEFGHMDGDLTPFTKPESPRPRRTCRRARQHASIRRWR